MKKLLNNDAFTLIEMMIVLLIISVLILIALPNVTKHSKAIDKKGCEAYKSTVQSQVEAYKIEHQEYPTSLTLLVEKGFMNEPPACPDGTTLTIENGVIK